MRLMTLRTARQSWITLLFLLLLSINTISCGSAEGSDAEVKDSDGETTVGESDDRECGATVVKWAETGAPEEFEYTAAWAERYDVGMKKGFQVFLLNYPREEFSPYRDLIGSQRKLLLDFHSDNGAEATTGTYNYVSTTEAIADSTAFGIVIWTPETTIAPTIVDHKNIGKLTVTQADDETLCGSFEVKAESGMTFIGSFNLPVEKSRY